MKAKCAQGAPEIMGRLRIELTNGVMRAEVKKYAEERDNNAGQSRMVDKGPQGDTNDERWNIDER